MMRRNEVYFIARDILCAFLITIAIGWVGLFFQIQLGLDWLITSAWLSLLLSGLNIAFLWVAFSGVREMCWSAPRTVNSKPFQVWSRFVVGGNALVLCVTAILIFSHSITWHSHDVGWTYYFSLPRDRRPDFLLIYLLLSAVVSCVIGPVVEELLHVGVIIGRLRDRNISWPVVYVVNAVLFAAIHQAFSKEWIGWAMAIKYAGGRLFFDYLFRKTGNIIVPVAGHVLSNIRFTLTDLLPFFA